MPPPLRSAPLTLAAALLSLACVMASTRSFADDGPGSAQWRKEVTPAALAAVKQWGAFLRLLAANPQNCPDGANECKPAVTVLFVPGDSSATPAVPDHCVAIAPHITFPKPPNPTTKLRKIVWTLDKSQLPAGDEAEFDDSRGIFLLEKSRQVVVRGPGDGGGDETGEITYYATNKHKRKETTSYLPTVIYTPKNKEAILCAGVDPRIVNLP